MTPPRAPYGGLTSPSSSQHSANPSLRRLDKDEIEEFLKSPHTLVNKKFSHSPAQGASQSKGIWKVVGFMACVIDDEVDQEFEVLFDEPGGPIPMDIEDIRDLLESSKLFI